MDNSKKVILLFSGGIDSTVILYWLIRQKYIVYPMVVNYGQKTYKGELSAIQSILSNVETESLYILDVANLNNIGRGSLIGEYPDRENIISDWYNSEFFPNRNLYLLSFAAAYGFKLNIFNLSIGVVGRESYKDTTLSFLQEVQNILRISLGNFNIVSPFADLDRSLLLDESIKLNVPLKQTFSCNSIHSYHCNFCLSCREREEAFNYIKK